MKFLVISIVLCGLLLHCKASDQKTRLPQCMVSKIKDIKSEPTRNPPAEVWQWEFKHTVYYYVTSPCCDQYNYLYNDLCEIVCAPDGGFTGKGDRNCPDFDNTIKKTLIWKDERK